VQEDNGFGPRPTADAGFGGMQEAGDLQTKQA
jgi:hypothetical protein